ncbi:MAG: FkbM family methyltransferase [Candidatus Didemnitutus sp.]|nr:FkbM family methyltransferase [Candidatus Didemnitutus sp.]
MDLVLKFTRSPSVPLSLRRLVGKLFVKKSPEQYRLKIGQREYIGRRDNYIEWLVYVTGDYFEYTYLNLLRRLFSGGVALDVGANVGNHSLAFSEIFDSVHSFEPFPLVAKRLAEKTVATGKVTVNQMALGETNGTAHFIPPATDNLGTGRISESGGIEVRIARGDDFVATNLQGKINFIKIDVEGHEVPVLRGLRETIARDRPGVMFEVARDLQADGARGLLDCFKLFPEDYQFACMKGQSTFPLQKSTADAWAAGRESLGVSGRITYVLAYGPERGFRLDGTTLTRS